MLQPVADIVKLLAKEDIVPAARRQGPVQALPVVALAAV